MHSILQPVDVVKTRIQLDPVKYNQGMVGGFKQVIAAEGTGALLTGLGATAAGYFVQVRATLRPTEPNCSRSLVFAWNWLEI